MAREDSGGGNQDLGDQSAHITPKSHPALANIGRSRTFVIETPSFAAGLEEQGNVEIAPTPVPRARRVVPGNPEMPDDSKIASAPGASSRVTWLSGSSDQEDWEGWERPRTRGRRSRTRAAPTSESVPVPVPVPAPRQALERPVGNPEAAEAAKRAAEDEILEAPEPSGLVSKSSAETLPTQTAAGAARGRRIGRGRGARWLQRQHADVGGHSSDMDVLVLEPGPAPAPTLPCPVKIVTEAEVHAPPDIPSDDGDPPATTPTAAPRLARKEDYKDSHKQVSQDVHEEMSKQGFGDPPKEVCEEGSHELHKVVSREGSRVSNEETQKGSKNVSKDVTEGLAEDVTGDMVKNTEDVAEDVAEDLAEDVAEDVADDVTGDVTKQDTPDDTTDITERVTEKQLEKDGRGVNDLHPDSSSEGRVTHAPEEGAVLATDVGRETIDVPSEARGTRGQGMTEAEDTCASSAEQTDPPAKEAAQKEETYSDLPYGDLVVQAQDADLATICDEAPEEGHEAQTGTASLEPDAPHSTSPPTEHAVVIIAVPDDHPRGERETLSGAPGQRRTLHDMDSLTRARLQEEIVRRVKASTHTFVGREQLQRELDESAAALERFYATPSETERLRHRSAHLLERVRRLREEVASRASRFPAVSDRGEGQGQGQGQELGLRYGAALAFVLLQAGIQDVDAVPTSPASSV